MRHLSLKEIALLKIDFVSDVSCPWCAIGLNALELALARVGPDISATVHFQPFELNPKMAPEGQDMVEHISQKYGINAEQIAANADAIRQRGAALGFDFGVGQRKRIYNTFNAHRLLHWAGLQGAEPQRALKHALLKAYFTDGQDPSDSAVLLAAAGASGLDVEAARTLLAGDEFTAEVRQAQGFYHQQGINSVPAVIINDRHLISGGQPVEVFEQALRQIAAAAA
jgi:predicted DsbA family dithiol-disulfide isomerase